MARETPALDDDDFAYLIDTFGHVPNGARTYYLSRSQPPFFLGQFDSRHILFQ